MFCVYLLESEKDDELYVGITADLRNRLEEHNQGLNSSTARYIPWELIYYEACIDKEDALRRERYLKTTHGRRAIRKRLQEYFKKSKNLAK